MATYCLLESEATGCRDKIFGNRPGVAGSGRSRYTNLAVSTRRHPFIVRLDHQALQRKLHKATHDPPISARQARWIERLMPFALTFEYLKGGDNIVADALSRYLLPQLYTVIVISAQLSGILVRMALAATSDRSYIWLVERARAGSLPGYEIEKGLVVTLEGIIVVPQDHQIRTLLLSEAHDSRLGGHFGTERTLEKMRRVWT